MKSSSLRGRLALFFLALALLAGCSYDGGSVYSFEESDGYSYGGAELPSDGITSLNIDWLLGSVCVMTGGDTVGFSETCDTELGSSEQLRYLVKDGTLYIKFCSPRSGSAILAKLPEKALTVTLPEGLAAGVCRVDSVSASVDLSGLNAGLLEVSATSASISLSGCSALSAKLTSVSGSITAAGVTCNSLATKCVSGAVSVSGEVESVAHYGTSGTAAFSLDVCPKDASIETVSGTIHLMIPDGSGFTADVSSVSGGFSCDFEHTRQKNHIVAGDGSAAFTLESTSGNITIDKIK